ncbi:MAG: KamA family radical SAM protein, partial [Candidatus Thermoplasmatota archaeon]|nr:KamA family radical SAM protein [Candidatus Thermoplasmatota archaeon]
MWEDELEKSIRTIDELLEYADISDSEVRKLRQIVERHPLLISRYYLSLIDWSDPNDPIRHMAVPSIDELDITGSYDTSGEKVHTKMVGLQHKYRETALVLCTNRCAMYCRHCFRKRLVGLSDGEIVENFENAAKYIEEHPEICNVLISGGDPLVLRTEVLENFLESLAKIEHLRFVRIGSRVPVTFPHRINEDDELMALFRKHSMPERRLYVVTHFNHPREITEESTRAVARLIEQGVVINNQTVLLRGVNDDSVVLAELQSRLVGIGVNPYYVFQCRPVKRVKTHFQVPLDRGIRIVEGAKSTLDGHSKRFRYIMSHKRGKIEIL